MGRIFISAGHYVGDPGARTASGTTEAQEMMLTRDLVVRELESRGVEFLSVPDTLDLVPTIQWINARAVSGDVALELHGNSFNGSARGTEAFYINGNNERQKNAKMLLDTLIKQVPSLVNRGAKPDNSSVHPRLAFCRDVAIPSVLIELCFLDNPQDLALLQNQRDLFAKGLADGLVQWSKQIPQNPPPVIFPMIDIKINDQLYEDKGIIVNNNSFIPIDLVDRLGIDIAQAPNIRRISQGGIVYVKAIELQQFNVSISFDSQTKTVILNTVPRTLLGQIDRIMNRGNTSKEQLTQFLKINNEKALDEFADLPELYIKEAAIEGVNHDIAFCQMCLETGFLRFGGDVEPEQNNFCGLGAVGGGVKGASFEDAKTGVKAHIQHLKAYASIEPIAQPPIVDPRFNLVRRGIAPLVDDLSGRFAADLQYGTKIMALLRRLYAIAGLL
ncbi:MAG TPA: N-acetylmuramoyl-L-alanine amidase [Oculatellaceae cyanobacterium]